MKRLVPGRFSGASIATPAGEVEVRFSDGGTWQLRGRGEGEFEWRLLCTGNLDGGVFTPPPDHDRAPIKLGPLTVDLAARRAHVDGAVAKLTAREFDLLVALAENPGRLFTKKQLLTAIWGQPDTGSSRTLESHASRLRCKLRDVGAEGFVVSYRDLGYRLWEGGEPAESASLRAA